jgi:REP-associated tyrosine transposase
VKYNPDLHHRRSIRLNGYDYSRSGLYFITICAQDRLCLFGEIKNGAMILNDAGKMMNKWWHELKHKYQNIKLHEQIVMPNHFHGIIEIDNTSAHTDPAPAPAPVGADLCVCPVNGQTVVLRGQTHRSAPTDGNDSDNGTQKGGYTQKGGHTGPPLHAMVQWFKTMTTNEYIRGVKQNNWPRFNKKLWQRNYYEHIVRSEKSYLQISDYIRTNPMKWHEDKYYERDNIRKHI